MTTERQIIDRQRHRIQQLQCDLARMTKRAGLYKAAVGKQSSRARFLSAELYHVKHIYAEKTEKLKRCKQSLSSVRDGLNRNAEICERQAASYAHDRAMFAAKEERTRQALQEGGQACRGDLCICKTSDCQSRPICGLSGRTVTNKE